MSESGELSSSFKMSQSRIIPKVWSQEEVEKLISVYENHPILWDIHSKEYRNREKKDRILKDIAEEFCTDVSIVSHKLHNLRTQFFNEKRKEETKKSGQGSTQVYASKWLYFDSLKFLLESRTLRPGIENISLEVPVLEDEINEIILEEVTMPETPVLKKSSKRSRAAEDALLTKATSVLSNVSNDEWEIFGRFIASEIRNLKSEDAKKKAKRTIQMAIFELQDEEF